MLISLTARSRATNGGRESRQGRLGAYADAGELAADEPWLVETDRAVWVDENGLGPSEDALDVLDCRLCDGAWACAYGADAVLIFGSARDWA